MTDLLLLYPTVAVATLAFYIVGGVWLIRKTRNWLRRIRRLEQQVKELEAKFGGSNIKVIQTDKAFL